MGLQGQSFVAVAIVMGSFCLIPLTFCQSLRAPDWKEDLVAYSNLHLKNIIKGSEVNLPCSAKGHPRPEFFFRKDNGTFFTESERVKLKGSRLRIMDIQPADNGNYTCIANNSLGTIEFTFLVDVKEAPEWREDSDAYNNFSMKSATEGTELKLSCPAKGNPKPDVFWHKDGAYFLPNSEKIKVKGNNLKFTEIQTSDRGNYTCTANNSINKIEFTFLVDVKKRLWPLVVNISDNLTIYEGGDAKFFCIVENDKTARIQWLRIKLTNESQARDSRMSDESSEILVLHDVRKEDGGQYACQIGNQYGSKHYHMYLTVMELTTPTTTTTTTTTSTTPTTSTTTKVRTTQTTAQATTRRTVPEKPRTDKVSPKKKKKPIKKYHKKEKPKKNKKKKDPDYDDLDFDIVDNNRVHTQTPDMVDKYHTPAKDMYGVWKTNNAGDKIKDNMNMKEPNGAKDADLDTNSETGSYDIYSTLHPDDGDNMYEYNRDISNTEARNATSVTVSSRGGISIWTVYIIVGAIAGGLLLAGLVAIAIAIFCQREDESQYKSTSV